MNHGMKVPAFEVHHAAAVITMDHAFDLARHSPIQGQPVWWVRVSRMQRQLSERTLPEIEPY